MSDTHTELIHRAMCSCSCFMLTRRESDCYCCCCCCFCCCCAAARVACRACVSHVAWNFVRVFSPSSHHAQHAAALSGIHITHKQKYLDTRARSASAALWRAKQHHPTPSALNTEKWRRTHHKLAHVCVWIFSEYTHCDSHEPQIFLKNACVRARARARNEYKSVRCSLTLSVSLRVPPACSSGSEPQSTLRMRMCFIVKCLWREFLGAQICDRANASGAQAHRKSASDISHDGDDDETPARVTRNV